MEVVCSFQLGKFGVPYGIHSNLYFTCHIVYMCNLQRHTEICERSSIINQQIIDRVEGWREEYYLKKPITINIKHSKHQINFSLQQCHSKHLVSFWEGRTSWKVSKNSAGSHFMSYTSRDTRLTCRINFAEGCECNILLNSSLVTAFPATVETRISDTTMVMRPLKLYRAIFPHWQWSSFGESNLGPLCTGAQVEGLNLQFSGVWKAFSQKLKLLRAWPIFKLSIVWPSVKRPWSKWAIKRGMIPNKGAFMTSQRMLKSPLAWGPQNESSSSQYSWPTMWRQIRILTSSLPKVTQSLSSSHFTGDPSRHHLSAVSPVKSLHSQVRSSCMKWLWVNKHAQEDPSQWEGSFLWALNLSSVKGANDFQIYTGFQIGANSLYAALPFIILCQPLILKFTKN